MNIVTWILIATVVLCSTLAHGQCQRCGWDVPSGLQYRVWNHPRTQRHMLLPLIPQEYSSEQSSQLIDFLDPWPQELPFAKDPDGKITDCANYVDNDEHQAERTKRPSLRDMSLQWKKWMEEMTGNKDWDENSPFFKEWGRDWANDWSTRCERGKKNDDTVDETVVRRHERHYQVMLQKKQDMEHKLAQHREEIRQLEQNIENEYRHERLREQLQAQKEHEVEMGRQRKEMEQRSRRHATRPRGETKRHAGRPRAPTTQPIFKQDQRQFQADHQPRRAELFSFQIPSEYTQRNIKVRTSGADVKIVGKRVCDCNENCAVKEFERSFKLPQGVSTNSLQVQLFNDGILTIEGAIDHQAIHRLVDMDVQVQPVGLFEDNESIGERLECLKKKSGFKMSKMDKNTGETYEAENFTGMGRGGFYKGVESECEDDGVTIEIEE